MRTPHACRAILAAIALLLSLSAAGPASAHLAGSAPLYQSGNQTLAPWGSPNYTLHAYLDQIGLPPSVGDTLRVEFAVNNGTGAPILFEIHTHAGLTGYKVYYNRTVSGLRDNWTVPEAASYMIYFENPYNFSVFLTYSFVLNAPPPDTSILLFIFPATAGLALGWFFFVRAGLRVPPPSEDGEGEDGDGRDSPDDGEAQTGAEAAPAVPTAEPPPGR